MDQAAVIGLTVPVVAGCMCAIFLSFWYYNREDRSALRFATAFFLAVTGFSANHYILDKDTLANAIFHNACYSGGLYLLLDGIHLAFSRKTPVGTLGTIGIGSVIAAVIIQLSPADLGQRVLWINTLQGCMLLVATASLWGIWRSNWTGTATYAALILCAINMVVVAPYNIVNSFVSGDVFFQTAYWATMNMVTTLSVTAMGGALVAVCVMQRLADLREDADHDYLTGLKTRRAFEEAARYYCDARSGEVAATLIIIDIDHFKTINDEHGHVAGDQVIGRIGAFLNAQTRSSDVAGRMGGEEFCLLLPGTDTAGARQLAARLRAKLSNLTFDALPETLRVTASFGIAEFGRRTAFADAYPMADAALYSAKTRGRDRIVCAPAPEDAGRPIRRERFKALPDGSRVPVGQLAS
ncbi:GGDEF domain-containing protein [Henriciella mobilis]|uniref:GGDEF domain-containing protein n=1 Tax=Henriciella mobilis TaxID=2305467 RepID=UPI0013140AA5|nr:GGDEF domain-containing protein [Henriciella mobilis]